MRQIACGLLAAGLIATTATAEAQELGSASFLKQARSVAADLARTSAATAAQAAPADEPPPVKITGGIDFPSLYVFRGLRQETDADFTAQPFVNVAFVASPAATLNVGSWNSFHGGSNSDAFDNGFYESDFYVSGAFTTGKVTTTALYTAYMSPADAFGTVHELAFTAGFSDSDNRFPVSPAVTLAFELGDNTADGGDKGIYLELAATPAIPVGDDAPLTLAVPIKFGFSLKDYYQLTDANGNREDHAFGYFSIGLMGLVPLSPNFDIHGGVIIYAFGDTPKAFNGDDGSEVVGTIGLGFSF